MADDLDVEADAADAETQEPKRELLTAREIKAHLDTKVIGQDAAKIQMSVLLSMHMNWFKRESRLHRAPNSIVIGPTGVGKTHSLRIASEYLKIPFISVDTTSLVPSGIVGYQIEDVLADLVREAQEILKRKGQRNPADGNRDIELARQGIIFFDEFDKISTTSAGGDTGNTGNLTVQRRLLKLTDGAVLSVGVRGHQSSETPRSIDASGILIVVGGAFVGIDDNKIRTSRPVPLQRDLGSNPNVIVSADVVTYGFMPELVARLPVIIEYGSLSDQELRQILELPDVSPIQVWREHFKQMGTELIITEDAKEYAVKRAQVLKMGARGLQQVLFQSLAAIAFEIETSEATSYEVSAQRLMKISSKSYGGKNDNK
jgi:ATP-dependent Clp protease ATP-binding subunit ClpX